jgi:hypothetical protein
MDQVVVRMRFNFHLFRGMRQQVVVLMFWSECVVREKKFGGGKTEIKENWAANGQANVASYFGHKECANYIF